MTEAEMKQRHAKMTHRDWLERMDKKEAIFRMFGKRYNGRSCYQCVFYKRDSNGEFMCYSSEHEGDCRDEFNEWIDEEMEE